jgi:hypothetical protein
MAMARGSASESDSRGAVLAAFARALRRESHILQNQPELLWQQLHNRLQWEKDPVPSVLEPAFQERSSPGGGPWLRTRTPFRESSALLSVLEGHSDSVNGCALSIWSVSSTARSS